jgi:hypothetical protein
LQPKRNLQLENRSVKILALLPLLFGLCAAHAQSKHDPASRFPAYQGLVMCGYQGWFRAQGDGSGQGWVHYGTQGRLDATHIHLDLWPDVSEYAQTYATGLTNTDGSVARVFSSWDASTTDLHFKWMQQYGIDGVFMQRFFYATRTEESRRESRVILGNALKSSQNHGRAIAVMYDLSGIKASGEDCASIIQDWKELVDDLKITSQGTNQTYLYDHGKPLVTIWGLGFPDRAYSIHRIGVDKLIDFLKHDPQYGGCAVMLGVPTHFRELNTDCLPDPYLHELIAAADIVMPWMVGRFSPLQNQQMARYATEVKADIAWCDARQLEYAPCVYPGFSWFNLSKTEFGGGNPLDQIPRLQGKFYWSQICAAKASGAKMLYVAMFDEMDEGTAIFKCTSRPPPGARFVSYEGVPADHYLWLTGQAGKMLRDEIPLTTNIPARTMAENK